MNRILARSSRARIFPRILGTAIGTLTLTGRVIDKVSLAATTIPFKCMQQTQPMPRLMHRRLAHVVTVDRTPWYRASGDVAPISHVHRGGGVTADIGGEGALAKYTTSEVRLKVQIQIGIRAFAQRLLHGEVKTVGAADGPGVVSSKIRTLEREEDGVGIVRIVECRDLLLDLVVRDHTFVRGGSDDVDVDADVYTPYRGRRVAGGRRLGGGGGGAGVGLATEEVVEAAAEA